LRDQFFHVKENHEFQPLSDKPHGVISNQKELKQTLIEELANCRLTHKQCQGLHRRYAIIRITETEVLLLASFCMDQGKQFLVIMLNSWVMYCLNSFFILMKCDGASGMPYAGCKLIVSLKNNKL